MGILGGGIGGVVAANVLRREASRELDIAIVDTRPDHYFPPSYLHVMSGELDPEDAHRPLERLRRKRIEPIVGEILSIDPAKRRVVVDKDAFEFDHLVLALGADVGLQSIQGLEGCHTFQTFEGAVRLRQELAAFQGGDVLLVITGSPYRCPDAPYEAAFLIDGLLRSRGLRDKSPMHLATVEPDPMPIAGSRVAGRIRAMLSDRSIEYSTLRRLISVDHSRKIATYADGVQQSFELIIVVPPLVAPAVVRLAGMVSETGWVSAGPLSMSTMFENIYAIGDVCSVRLPNGRYLPKLGVFASRQGEVVAKNLLEQVKARPQQHRYRGDAECILEVGRGRAASIAGNFYANPEPKVKLRNPTRRKHWSKSAYERHWFRHWL